MEKTNKKTLEEIIRVDHAGERGAIKIYEGQLLALKKLPDLLRRYNRFEKFAKSRLLTPEEIAEAKAKAASAKAEKTETKPATDDAGENKRKNN